MESYYIDNEDHEKNTKKFRKIDISVETQFKLLFEGVFRRNHRNFISYSERAGQI